MSFLLYGYLCKTSTIDSLLCPPLKRLDYEFRVHVPIYFRGSKNVYFKDTNNVYFFFDMYLGLCYPFKVIHLEMKCVYITLDDTCVLTFTVLRGAIHFEYKTVRLRLISSYFIEWKYIFWLMRDVLNKIEDTICRKLLDRWEVQSKG